MPEAKPQLELAPALAKAIEMPPALVQAIREDPEILVQLTRGQLALVQDRMISKAMADPEISIAQLAIVHERLSKNARLEAGQGQGAGGGAPGFSVVININGAAEPKELAVKGEVVS